MGTGKMGALRLPDSDEEDMCLEIKIRELAKILSNDRRLKDHCLYLASYLGIRPEDAAYITKNSKTEQKESTIQTTLEYWQSIFGDKATVKKLSADLSKKSYTAITDKLKPYLRHTVVPDNDVKIFDLNQDEDDPKDASNALDEELFAKMSGMEVEEVDTDGYGTKDSIIIDGLKDTYNEDVDNKNVQFMLDKHKCSLEVVECRRFQGRDKNIRSLKVRMKAKGNKPKLHVKSLMNRALQNLQRSVLLANNRLTVTGFDVNSSSSSHKKKAFIANVIRLGGDIIKLSCHYVANKLSR